MRCFLSTITLILLFSLTTVAQTSFWDVYLADYDGKPGSTIVDMSLKDKAPFKAFPFCLRTGPVIQDCNENGFPSDSAAMDLCNSILEKTDTVLFSKFKGMAVGTFMMNCSRENYYYLADTIGVRKAIAKLYEKRFPGAMYDIKIKRDPTWSIYLTFLYPNEQTHEWMKNSKITLRLQGEGDDLMIERPVDHFFHFKDKTGVDRFTKEFLNPLGYQVTMEMANNKSENIKLQARKNDYPELNHITRITFSFLKEAIKYDGGYDGWETSVVK